MSNPEKPLPCNFPASQSLTDISQILLRFPPYACSIMGVGRPKTWMATVFYGCASHPRPSTSTERPLPERQPAAKCRSGPCAIHPTAPTAASEKGILVTTVHTTQQSSERGDDLSKVLYADGVPMPTMPQENLHGSSRGHPPKSSRITDWLLLLSATCLTWDASPRHQEDRLSRRGP